MKRNEYHLATILINQSVTEFKYDFTKIMTQEIGNFTAVYTFENNQKSILITKEFCETNRIRVNELHEAALQQQRAYYEWSMQPIENYVGDLFPEELVKASGHQLFVVSSERPCYGASVILQPEVLENIAKKVDGDYFILPSSLHEVIILKDSGRPFDEKFLNGIVRSVNETVVAPYERLSDRVIRGSEMHMLLKDIERRIDRGRQR
jgi:hypothetical protein